MNRVALVTGASRGIGRSIAVLLAARGHHVAVNYRTNGDAAAEVVEAIEGSGGEALAVQADVSDADQVAAMFTTVEEHLGAVEVLVNNAGVTRDGLLMRMQPDAWDEVLATDLRSAYLCSRAALRAMVKERWGRIVSIGSVSGIAGNAGQANYAAAKAGLIGFSKSLAKEVGSRGITVNVVAPGFIETDLTADLAAASTERMLANISVGRFGRPEEIASVVGYLASDEAGYITGQAIVVDGGLAL
ncbi:MAG: 3-oxoacyl-[acyl-carrier-protein] reductase [Acidimicrobiia bacterium]|jgi:3-oxoacyl-[acyl-carrier protein] reductase